WAILVRPFKTYNYLLLHEIAHGIAGPRVIAAHGTTYCGIYLALVREFMSPPYARKLRSQFDSNKVRYSWKLGVGEQGRRGMNGSNQRIGKGGFNMLTTQNLLDSLDRCEREDYSLQLFGVCPKCPEPDPIKEESQSGRGRIP